MNQQSLDYSSFFFNDTLDDNNTLSDSLSAKNASETNASDTIFPPQDEFTTAPVFHDDDVVVGNETLWYTAAPSFPPTLLPTSPPTWPPPPNETATSTGLIESTDTRVLRNTIQVYGTLYLILLLLFCFLRMRYNKYFNIRSWAEGLECDIAKNSKYGFVSWIWKVFEVDEDDILEQCGMDALCFIRVLRLGRKLSFVGCIHAIWLIPVYATAEESAETWYLEDKLVLISTAHLPSGSRRFLATIICAYICFGYTMWLLKRELQWYTIMRHKFLSQRRPRNYAVYVAGIPEHLRSGHQLAEFFRQTGATSSVLEAQVTLTCPELESLVAQREDVKARLAHAKAFEEIHGAREKKLTLNLGGLGGSRNHNRSSNALVATVDSIEMLELKLRQLTKDIAIAYQAIERSNDPYSIAEHREMVMQEIAELREAERCQNSANRERVNSCHDLENEEEIFHVQPEEELIDEKEKLLPVNERFSKVAERFFFGDLSPSQQREREQRKLFRQRQEEEKRERDFHVTIHTSQNSIHMLSSRSSEEPEHSFSSTDRLLNGTQEKNLSSRPPLHPSSSQPPKLVHNAFPSKSTISTVPGTFENEAFSPEWNRVSSFDSSEDSHNQNRHFQNPGMPNVAAEVGSASSQESEGEERQIVVRKSNNHGKSDIRDDSDSGDELKSSNRSWSTDAAKAIRLVTKGVQKFSGDMGKTVVDVGSGVGEVTKNSLKVAGDIGISNLKNVSELGVKNVKDVTELGVENMKTIRASAAAVVPVIMQHEEGKALEAGFVVFKDLYSTQAALQMLHHKVAGVMQVEEAPGPNEIFWRNVGLPGTAQRTGRLLSLAATVVLCLFWTVPISFISALTEVNSLKENVPVLARWVEKYPSLEGVLALIAPLLLLILQDVLLPEFLAWFATWEGHISSSALEAAVFVKYAAFVLIQTFFISAISGSISAELSNMLNEPDQFVDFLANALPAQSNYFLQILVVAMAVTMGVEMLRVSPLGMAFARSFIGPRLTEEERRKKWKFLTPLEAPREFEHANISGSVVLYFMVYFVYCCLAPVSCFFLLVMFFLMESGYRYQFYHNYPPTPDSGGKHWMGFLHILQGCMIVAQLTLVGFLILKQSLYAIPFLVPLLTISILFIIYLNNYKLHVMKHLPSSDCVEVDKRNKLKDFSFVKGKYIQPCIREALSDEIFELI